jgi:predicted nucleotidyltransferase
MNEKLDLPQEIKDAVHRIDPNAEVYLYGSRARGDAGRHSDWDILLLLSREDKDLEHAVVDAIYDLEIDRGQVFSVIAHSKAQWDQPLLRNSPFRRNIQQEMILL